MEREEQSLARKLGQYGGLIALILSIVTGAYTIYDKLIMEKARKSASEQAEIRRIVARITEINRELIELDSQVETAGNPQKMRQKLQFLTMNANGEKMALLEWGAQIYASLEDEIGFAAALTLCHESLVMGQNDRALSYADTAIRVAVTPTWKVEGMRKKAQVLFAHGSEQSIQVGREEFQKSIKLVREATSVDQRVVYTVYRDWIVSEATFGNCKMAKQKRVEAEKDIAEVFKFVPGSLKSFRADVDLFLSRQSKCAY